MSGLIDTTEMYLKAVLELEEEGITPLRARIAERLGHAGPTVSQTVARMERDGLLILGGNRQIRLTAPGNELAVSVMRRHRLAECLLLKVLGMPWPQLHTEACRWEHVISLEVEKRLFEVLGHPTHDPYGNPIPGITELTDGRQADAQRNYKDLSTLTDDMRAAGETSREVVFAAIGEPLQVDPGLLERFQKSLIVPDTAMTISLVDGDDGVVLRVNRAEIVIEVPQHHARHLFVK